MATDDRGFASMDEDKQREIASKGGKASGGNFANDREKAGKAGKKGAENQPTPAKRKGGERSHDGGR
ncbi:MAG: KGG domain-containing protein [Candidatus Saccharimonadales bacterium]